MKNIYTTYVDSILSTQKSTFYKSKLYLFYDHSYEKIKDKIEKAELLLVGEICHPNLKDYIKPSFIGKIKNIGSFKTKYNENSKKLEVNELSINIGSKEIGFDETYIGNLIIDQEKRFNNDLFTSLDSQKRFFIQVEKNNNFDDNVLYKKIMNHNIIIQFNEDGSIIAKDYKRFFKMNYGIVYDILEGSFYKDGKFIKLQNQDSSIESIKTIMNFLIENNDREVKVGEILKKLGKNPESSTEKTNWHKNYKDKLEKIFINKIGIDREIYKKELILYGSYNEGYKIIGEKIDSIN